MYIRRSIAILSQSIFFFLMTNFSDIWVSETFCKALDAIWYKHPSPIQEQAIPLALKGADIFWCAQTGTGKTAAFMLPMLQRMHETHDDSNGKKKSRIRWLIITPTRELAIQIGESTRDYTKRSNIKHTVIHGWVSDKPQVKKIRAWIEVLIATPGRLLDLIQQKHVNLAFIETFVLDEADRMLDMGFIHDIKKIANYIPKQRQTLFFSATFAPKVMDLAQQFLIDPVTIEIAPQSSTVDTVKQHMYTLNKEDKAQLLLHILKRKDVWSAIVFSRTKHGANKIEKNLLRAWIKAAAIHGNKSQNARQRALKALKNGDVNVLVATDVAARGIDINKLSTVIIHDVPNEPESYVHRIGRTWRAGESGQSFTMLCHEETKLLNAVLKLIGKPIPIDTNQPFHVDIDLKWNYPQLKQWGWGGGRRNQKWWSTRRSWWWKWERKWWKTSSASTWRKEWGYRWKNKSSSRSSWPNNNTSSSRRKPPRRNTRS